MENNRIEFPAEINLRPRVTVLLRDRRFAVITGTCDLGGFVLQGRMGDGSSEIWTEQGRWCADGREHPLDIIGYVNRKGQIALLNKATP